ncbi:hypothetical protein BDY24DRAFT_418089 [Mrakia frigida]|uniref:uncharacterized protein n=1 Tax=Mrakia frigida TaxID=29902 RepID=UPI003FCBF625
MPEDRSRSRGREPMVSTGRGGAGNLRSLSQTGLRDSSNETSVERGRHVEVRPTNTPTHSGRGGSGNVRSPSRDPADRARTIEEDALEAQLVRERRAADAGRIRSSGRGGQGNFVGGESLERSVSRERERAKGASVKNGRGGAGNWGVAEEGRDDLRTLEEEDDRVRHHYAESRAGFPQSYGKGGAGNIHSPGLGSGAASNHTLVEPPRGVSFEHKVSGRGGAGNFHPSATPPSPPEDRGRAGGENRPQQQTTTGGGGVVEGLKNLPSQKPV